MIKIKLVLPLVQFGITCNGRFVQHRQREGYCGKGCDNDNILLLYDLRMFPALKEAPTVKIYV